jgi:hypothetical protein
MYTYLGNKQEKPRKNNSRRLKHKTYTYRLFLKNTKHYDHTQEKEIYNSVNNNLDLTHKHLINGHTKKEDIKNYDVNISHAVYQDGILLNVKINVSYYSNIIFNLNPFIFDISMILNIPSNLIMNIDDKPVSKKTSIKKQYIEPLDPILEEEPKKIIKPIVKSGAFR